MSTLGKSIERGNMTAAASQIETIISKNSEYLSSTDKDGQSSEINEAFEALESSVAAGDSQGADDAWGTIKGLLAKSGLEAGSSKLMADKLYANITSSLNDYLINSLAGITSGDFLSDPTGSLLGVDSEDKKQTSLNDALVNWMTYESKQDSAASEEDSDK